MKTQRHGPLAAAILLAAAPVQAQDAEPATGPARWESGHSIIVGGETIQYDAVVSGITLTNDDGDPAAELWYTGYFRTNGASARERPLVFAYNGGPGSASFWLHMGIMGPRRVVTPEVGPRGALSEHDRWNPPRYLLGESYGTTRSAVLASHLQRANIERADFAAGHMMYVEQSLPPQWKETLDRFILRTSGGAKPVSE